jgi:hypothetical protein
VPPRSDGERKANESSLLYRLLSNVVESLLASCSTLAYGFDILCDT